MTEKEFLRTLESMDIKTGDILGDICKEALRLAKERGAKFDPERIDLPELRAVGYYRADGSGESDVRLKNPRFVEGFGETYLLSSSQAEEVVYRCKKWNLIRNLVKSMASRDENPGRYTALLTILNVR